MTVPPDPFCMCSTFLDYLNRKGTAFAFRSADPFCGQFVHLVSSNPH